MPQRFKNLLGLLLPFILGIAVYCNTLSYGYVYDDSFFRCREEYKSIMSIPLAFRSSYSACAPLNGIYRPVPTITFILSQVIFGNSPMPQHLGNIILHGINSALFFVLLRLVFKIKFKISIAVALLFAVLPVHSEVVANIKSRDELITALSFLLMWIAYDKGKTKIVWYVASIISFMIALFSKETALVFPIIISIVNILLYPNAWKRTLIRVSGYVPVIIFYFVVRNWLNIAPLSTQSDVVYIFNPLIGKPFIEKVFSGLAILATYLEKTFLPFHLSATYHYAHFNPISNPLANFSWIAGVIILITLFFLASYNLSKKNGVIAGIVIFFILYLPISQVLFTGGDVLAERWMYLPSLGLIIIFSELIYFLTKKNIKVFGVFITLLITIYFFLTFTRNQVWRSDETLFTSMVKDAPKSIRGYTLLADYYLSVNFNLNKAKQTLNTVYAFYQDDAELNNLQAQVALLESRYSDAAKYLERSAIIDPRLVRTDRIWAQLYFVKGDYKSAQKYITKIISSRLYEWRDIVIYANILAKFGKFDEAQKWLDVLSAKEKLYVQAQHIQAVIYFKKGKTSEAMDLNWDNTLTKDQRIQVLQDF